MKTKINEFSILIWFLLLFVLTFTGCKPKEADVIKIGAILPLTGQGSSLGKGYQNSMDLALQYINENELLKTKIEILYEDSQSNSTLAVNSANKLIKINNVDILILANANIVESVTPIALQQKIPVIAITSTPDITKISKFVFRVWLNEYIQIEKISKYFSNNNFNRIGLLTVNNEYGRVVNEIINKKLKEHILFQSSYSPNSLDIKNEVIKIKDLNLDCIYILGNPPEYISLIRKIREYGFERKIFGTSALTVSFVREQLGDLLENTIFSGPKNLIYNYNSSPIAKFYNTNFLKKYNTEPEWFYGFCFDQIIFIANAIQKIEIGECNTLCEALNNIREFEGVNGKIIINQFGDAESEISLFTQKEDKIIEVN